MQNGNKKAELLMASQNSFDYEDLLRSSEGTLFDHDSARLPTPDMLMFNRIVSITSEGGLHNQGQMLAELDIDPDLWFFHCHFKSDPVMPGCLGLDALWQLTGFFLAWSGYKGKGRALGVDDVKFRGQILPTSQLVTYKIDIRRVIARKLVMVTADGTVTVDGRQVYTARNLRVGLFESTDNF